MDFPASDKELHLYFLLEDLKEARRVADRSLWQHGTPEMKRIAESQYEQLKIEYLTKLREWTKQH